MVLIICICKIRLIMICHKVRFVPDILYWIVWRWILLTGVPIFIYSLDTGWNFNFLRFLYREVSLRLWQRTVPAKELYAGTHNSDIRILCAVHCAWEECKQTQCPHRSWRERTKTLMWYYSPTKNKLKYQVRANV